jgi:ADP-dependent phosphofructokinase/glucokinase
MKNISKQINHYRTNLEIKCFDKTFKIFRSNNTINPIPYNKFKDFIKNYIKESIDKILNTYDMVDVYDFVLNNLDSDSDSDSD